MSNSGGRHVSREPKSRLRKKSFEAAARVAETGITPLEVMVKTMHALWAKATEKTDKAGKAIIDLKIAREACVIAEKAAGYMHPRLASVEQFIDSEVRSYAVSAEPLSEDEWARLNAIDHLAAAAGATESVN
jgi:hypothetical protein